VFRQHVNTPRYAKDAATKQYVDDVFDQVKPGASSSVFDYRCDATNTSPNDPGAGKYKYSATPQNSAETLYMDWLTQDGFDVVALFTTMKFGDEFIIQDKDLSVNYQKWKLLGPAQIMPDWFQIPVQFIEGDAVFTNNQLVSFVVTFVGQEGEPGPMGPQGPTGSQGPIGETGPGVAAGGSTGQILSKINNVDYNTQWIAPPTGDVTKSYVDNADSLRVMKSGDTMTGDLIMTKDTPQMWLNRTAAGASILRGQKNGLERWAITLGDGDAETGGNTGSSFRIYSFGDTGVNIGMPFTINRATSVVNFAVAPTVAGAPISAGGAYLPLTGGVLSGGISIDYSPYPVLSINDTGTTGSCPILSGKRQNKNRWDLLLGLGAESGTSTGSDFLIRRYDNAGTYLDDPIGITRADGSVRLKYTFFSLGINVAGAIYAPSKGHHFGVASGSQGVLADANIKLYDNGGGNWCGMGTDNFGAFWIRTGLADSAAKNFVINNVGRVFATNGLALGNNTGASPTDVTKNLALYGDAYGISVTGYTLNLVSNAVCGLSLVENGAGTVSANFQGPINTPGDVRGKDFYASRGNGTGVYYFAGGGDKYLYFDGSNFHLSGAPLVANIPGYFPKAGGTVDGSMNVNGNLNIYGGVLYMSTGGHYFQWDGANYHMPHGNLFILGQQAVKHWDSTDLGNLYCSGSVDALNSYRGRLGQGGAASNYFNIYWDGRAFLFMETSNVGQIMGVSDYRAKTDVENLKSMWKQVLGLRPISYKFSDWTPEWEVENEKKRAAEEKREIRPFVGGSRLEQWGFIAHELQETLIVEAATGYKDVVGTIQSPNWQPIVAAVTKALQEAMLRIEIIEGKLQ